MKSSKFYLRREFNSFLRSNLSRSFLSDYSFRFESDSITITSHFIISSVMINYLIIFCTLHDLGYYVSYTFVGLDFVPAFKIYTRG